MADKSEIQPVPNQGDHSTVLSETRSSLIARVHRDATMLAARKREPVLRASVKLNGRWGMINQTGTFTLEPVYYEVREFSCGRAAFSDTPLNYRYTGVHYEPFYYGRGDQGDLFLTPPAGSNCPFLYNYEGANWGFLDYAGSRVVNAQFKDVRNFSEDLAGVLVQGVEGFIDRDGLIAIEPRFDFVSDFQEDLAIVMVGRKCGFIDKSGRYVVKPHFDYVWPFSNGLACIEIGQKYGFITKSGDIAIEPRFESASDFRRGVARIRLNDREGLIDTEGNILFEHQGWKLKADELGQGRARFEVEEDRWRVTNFDGEFLGDRAFDHIGIYQEDLARVLDKENWGYIDKDGSLAIEARFPHASDFSCGMAAITDGQKWGFIDRTGQLVIPCQFESARDFQRIEA